MEQALVESIATKYELARENNSLGKSFEHIQTEMLQFLHGIGADRHEGSRRKAKPIRQIDIVRDNQFIHTAHPMKPEVSFRYKETQPPGRF